VVTEPTVSGMHDMERVVQMASHFRTRAACCINKFDINTDNADKIENWCKKNSIPIVGKIPFDEEVTESMVQGIPLTEYTDNPSSKEVKKIWRKIHTLLVGEENTS
jgi:MinD superfamily P-loop ATPase